jgi:hypothetical protein
MPGIYFLGSFSEFVVSYLERYLPNASHMWDTNKGDVMNRRIPVRFYAPVREIFYRWQIDVKIFLEELLDQ